MSKEPEECKAQLRAAVAEIEKSKKASSGNTCLENAFTYTSEYSACFANLTIDYAENPGVNPEILQEDEQYAKRQREAGERVLTRVIRKKNELQDAHTRLGIELGDVRAQLADSVKENKRLRRNIF